MNPPGVADIVKEYPQRGSMRQYRLAKLIAFRCFRCGQAKKSKLLVTYDENWERLLCNGCYGRLLSIFEIKAGTKADDEKAADLADLLLSLFSEDQVRENDRHFRNFEKRACLLSEKARRFVASSELVSQVLKMDADLEWSPATIGLCKAVETEVVERIVRPLKALLAGVDLSADLKDKDLGRVVKYFADSEGKPPELGTFAYFLQTSLNSKSRRNSSPVIRGLFQFFSSLPNSQWLSETNGFHESLVRLTRDFRNRAAHIDALTRSDYDECKMFVLGPDGILWKLVAATQKDSS